MKNVLITGGAGFISHHLIYYLIKKTNWNIVSLDRLDYSGNLNRLDNILSELSTHENGRIIKILNDAIQSVMVGQKSPEQALEKAQKQSDRILRRYR